MRFISVFIHWPHVVAAILYPLTAVKAVLSLEKRSLHLMCEIAAL